MNLITQEIDQFEPIDLADMDKIKLMNRTDTKYIFKKQQLPSILRDLQKDYFILEIDNQRLMPYENEYYDTNDFLFYAMHHRGLLSRHKVRIRTYKTSDIRFIEYKLKNNKSRTVKFRMKLHADEDIHHPEVRDFLLRYSSIDTKKLSERTDIHFNRITLAHKQLEDRCTLDINLHAHWNNKEHHFKNLVIAELKQEKFKHASPFNLCLKSHKIYPKRFSKYCFSILKTNPSVKANNFKPRLLQLQKILHD